MDFDFKYYPYPSRRSCVYAKRGIVACNNPAAAQAGMSVFEKGGNAIDAALAAAAALTVTAPASNGPGGDLFAIVHTPKGGLRGINSSGYSPKNLTYEMAREGCGDEIPFLGWKSTTVPGAPAGWAALSSEFGNLSMEEVFKPAVTLAREGFAVPTGLGSGQFASFNKLFAEGKESWAAGWYQEFAQGGHLATAGDIIKMPHLADTLEDIAATKAATMYGGRLSKKIVEWSKKTGGYFTLEDFEDYKPRWVDPISINYRGYDVCEIPPNGQGITALIALNILKGFDFDWRDDMYTVHRQMEAIKLAFADAERYVSDPRFMDVPIKSLLTDEYAARRRELIGNMAADPHPGKPQDGGTVYLCAADEDGNMISLIQSLYHGHGSGVTPLDTGMSIQCRGANFSLLKGHPNQYAPRKYPYHTIIPGFLMKDGKPVGPFGVMGGFMQPQGHTQVIMNTIDFHLNPQVALDAPRWCWTEGMKFNFESTWDNKLIEELRKRGHEINITNPSPAYGRGQIIWDTGKGSLVAGTEPRTDGGISGY